MAFRRKSALIYVGVADGQGMQWGLTNPSWLLVLGVDLVRYY